MCHHQASRTARAAIIDLAGRGSGYLLDGAGDTNCRGNNNKVSRLWVRSEFQEMNDLITEISSMTPLKLPRQRVLGTADIKKHYRIQFLQFIDMISVELKIQCCRQVCRPGEVQRALYSFQRRRVSQVFTGLQRTRLHETQGRGN